MDIDKLISDFEAKKSTYEELTTWAFQKISSVIKKGNLPHITIERRTKEIPSLRGKLQTGNFTFKTIGEIQDLSGIRVVTLLEKHSYPIIDVLRNLFGWENVEYIPKYSQNAYNADHLIVTVPTKMIRSKTKSKFKGLKFEVQVVSSLYSVWARLSHDLIYKDQTKLKLFNPEFHLSLENKFKTLMEDHLKPITDELDVIDSMVLAQGSGQIIQCEENLRVLLDEKILGKLVPKLYQLKESLRGIGNQTRAPLDLCSFCQALSERIRVDDFVLEETKDSFPRKTLDDLIEVLCDLFLFFKPDQLHIAIRCLLNLSRIASRPYTLKSINDMLSQLAKFDIRIIQAKGYEEYAKILDCTISDLETNGPSKPNITIWSKIICLEFESSDYDGEQILIKRGIPTITGDLSSLRDRALKEMFRIYPSLRLSQKVIVINALRRCYELPPVVRSHPSAIDEIEKTKDTIVKTFVEIINSCGLVETEILERHLEFIVQIFPKRKSKEARNLIKVIQKNKNYRIYKKMMASKKGFVPGRFTPELEGLYNELTLKIRSLKKCQELLSFAENISLELQSLDHNRQHTALAMFLEHFAKQHPRWIIKRLKKGFSKTFGQFDYPLLTGLGAVGKKIFVREMCLEAITLGKGVEVASLLQDENIFDWRILKDALPWATLNKNPRALGLLLNASILYLKSHNGRPISLRKILQTVILNDQEIYLHFVYGTFESNFKALDKELMRLFLRLQTIKKRLDDNDDVILSWICDLDPLLLIWFFEQRLKIESQWIERNGLFKTYKAVPDGTFWIEQSTLRESDVALRETLKWVVKGEPYKSAASNLINSVWGGKDSIVVDYLIVLCSKGPKQRVLLVLQFIQQIENGNARVAFVEKFINVVPKWREYQSSLVVLATYHGIVRGEEGFLLVHESDRTHARDRAKQSKGDIKEFWNYISKLSGKRTAVEHRRVDKEKARKRLVHGK